MAERCLESQTYFRQNGKQCSTQHSSETEAYKAPVQRPLCKESFVTAIISLDGSLAYLP